MIYESDQNVPLAASTFVWVCFSATMFISVLLLFSNAIYFCFVFFFISNKISVMASIFSYFGQLFPHECENHPAENILQDFTQW